MTLSVAFDNRRLAFRAIAVSFLFHAAILGLLIFNFQSKKISNQPVIVFLGSILQRHDVTGSDLAPQSSDNKVADEMIATMQKKLRSSTGRLSAVPANTTSKPALSAKPIGRPKKDTKTLSEFLLPQDAESAHGQTLSTDPILAPRQPLQLSPDDSH